jgi:hypothetical protein
VCSVNTVVIWDDVVKPITLTFEKKIARRMTWRPIEF